MRGCPLHAQLPFSTPFCQPLELENRAESSSYMDTPRPDKSQKYSAMESQNVSGNIRTTGKPHLPTNAPVGDLGS